VKSHASILPNLFKSHTGNTASVFKTLDMFTHGYDCYEVSVMEDHKPAQESETVGFQCCNAILADLTSLLCRESEVAQP